MAKQLEFVSGAVKQINSKGTGIKVNGLDDWLNISQYHPVAVMPTPGELVEVQFERTDKGVWIHALKTIGADSTTERQRELARDRLDNELYQREIRRIECLKAAATFASGRAIAGQDLKSNDVLRVAEAFERWVLSEGGDQPSDSRA